MSKLKSENNNFIYEFDDRFDKLPLSTDKKYNSSNAALVARFYWMLDNASALRVYSKTIVEDLPEHVQTKTKNMQAIFSSNSSKETNRKIVEVLCITNSSFNY